MKQKTKDMENNFKEFTIGKETNACLNLIATLEAVMDEAKDIDKDLEANLYFDIEQHYIGMRNELMNLASLSISNALFEGKHEV